MAHDMISVLEADLGRFYGEHPECLHPFLSREREELLARAADPEALERNTFALFSEILTPRQGFDRDEGSQKSYFDFVCEQVYRFFRKNGYEAEHYSAVAVKEMLITVTAVQIVQATDWNAAFVTAAVTLVVSTAVKLGVRA